ADVGPIDAGGSHPDQNLALARVRKRVFGGNEHIRAAGFADFDNEHYLGSANAESIHHKDTKVDRRKRQQKFLRVLRVLRGGEFFRVIRRPPPSSRAPSEAPPTQPPMRWPSSRPPTAVWSRRTPDRRRTARRRSRDRQ